MKFIFPALAWHFFFSGKKNVINTTEHYILLLIDQNLANHTNFEIHFDIYRLIVRSSFERITKFTSNLYTSSWHNYNLNEYI